MIEKRKNCWYCNFFFNAYPGKLAKMLLSNQIAEFFDHHYFLKETANSLEFLHGGSHQEKKLHLRLPRLFEVVRDAQPHSNLSRLVSAVVRSLFDLGQIARLKIVQNERLS